MEYVRDVMSSDPHTVSEDATFLEATQKMVQHDCGFLIAVDINGKVTGVITDRDIIVFGVAQGFQPNKSVVSDIMTREIVTCYDDETLDMAADHISENDIRRLVVLDRDENLKGVISIVDMLKHVEDDSINIEIIRHLFKYA